MVVAFDFSMDFINTLSILVLVAFRFAIFVKKKKITFQPFWKISLLFCDFGKKNMIFLVFQPFRKLDHFPEILGGIKVPKLPKFA